MVQKSWFNGAPSTAAPLFAAVMPGITESSTLSYSCPISYIREASPYIPASPLHTRETVLPSSAFLKHR